MLQQGLSTKEAQERLRVYGLNEIKPPKIGLLKQLAHWVIDPIFLMLTAAAFLSLLIGHYFEFYFIIGLNLLNTLIGIWHEKKSDRAIEELKKHLAIKVKVYREGKGQLVDSIYVVPGDIIELNVGDIVPADSIILDPKNLSVNEAVLTGESLPKDKVAKDKLFSGSFLATGWVLAEVTETGKNTYFGKTLLTVDQDRKKSLLEQDILSSSKFLTFLSLIGVVIISIFFLLRHANYLELTILDLSLLIAGVPVGLPTVMTMIISIGTLELAKKNVIVRRLASLEDLSNVNLLLSDKTGTLTKNEINVEKVIPYDKYSADEVLQFAVTAAVSDKSPIDQAVKRYLSFRNLKPKAVADEFTPADSDRKRSTAIISVDGKQVLVSVGAPQIIQGLSKFKQGQEKQYETDIHAAAELGFRSLAIGLSFSGKEENLQIIGVMNLSDTLRDDTKDTLAFLNQNGIGVKMVTGDNYLISKRVSADLGLTGEVIKRSDMENLDLGTLSPDWIDSKSVFSEIFPADKFNIVKLAKRKYTVAVTGDGVNDLPAVRAASVGIAVKEAVDALKSTADLVLLDGGISVIKEAIIQARAIFTRLSSYTMYRLSESFRVIFTIVILGIIIGYFPLTPLQLILLAILNDLPIISLAYDHVRFSEIPSEINLRRRYLLSTLYGLNGVVCALLFLFILAYYKLDVASIQTLFFLLLTTTGHMLVFVTHTEERWYRFLPSWPVVVATFGTQIFGSILALTGTLMHQVSWEWVLFMWIWGLIWMQGSDHMKDLNKLILNLWPKFFASKKAATTALPVPATAP